MCPHSAHRRRWNHQPFGDARHSTHPSPLGFEAGLIPRRPSFTYDFPFAFSVRKIMSCHQQDLPNTTLLRGGLSFGRLAEWQLAADRYHKFAISDGLGHELKSLRIRCRVHRYHLYGWILLGIPWCPENRCKHSPRLDLGDQFFSSLAVDRIRYDIEHRKIRNRIVVIGCDQLICADGLRFIHLALQQPCDHDRSPLLRSEYRRTPDISSSTYDENRLALFDSRSGN